MTETNIAEGQGKRRRLVYVHGFDLRGPKHYHALMTAELDRYAAIRGRPVAATAPAPAGHAPETSAQWRYTGGEGADAVDCAVHYLGWQDLVKTSSRLPLPAQLWRGAGALLEIAFTGPAAALLRANWPTALFLLYPVVTMLALLALILAPTLWLAAAGSWLWAPLAGALAVLVYRLSRMVEARSFFWFMVNDCIAIRDFAQNRDPAMSARIDAFADALKAVIDGAERDEDIVICGHSSGAFVALRALDRLLARQPDIGAAQARRPVFLTLGSGIGYTAFFRNSTTGAEAARVIASQRFLWTDVYSHKDPICSGRFDLVEALGLAVGGAGRPYMRNAKFSEALAPALHAEISRSFFDFHFAYLRAMSAPEAVDLYDLAIGPDPWAATLRPQFAAQFAA